jgi:glycosyltransferase involved in cell wall biosynthesis
MSRRLVSVMTIFLDEERFLNQAIESVLSQEYPNWELLLVDDGSTDGSTALARRYASEHPAVHYLEHPGHANRGMSESRNLALAHARGEFISMLDADDVWYPKTLALQVALLERHPRAALGCGTALWWRSWEGGGDFCDVVAARVPVCETPIEPPEFVSSIVRDGGAVPCPCTTIVRTSCLRSVGGLERSFRGMYEDQVLLAKIGLKWPVVVTTACLGRYRQHEGQTCVRAANEGTVNESRLRFLGWLKEYASDSGVRDESFWRDLEDALAGHGPPVP